MANDPQVPYRSVDTPVGNDYAAYMRRKMGIPAVQTSVLQPIPGQTLSGGVPERGINFSGSGMADKLAGKPITTSVSPTVGTNNNKNGLTLAQRVFSQSNMKKVGDLATAAAPFMSNVANAFRRPPMPKRGVPNPYVNLQKINLQEERNAVERGTHAANESADRNVDANTAEAIKAFNRGTEFEKLTSINDRQNQANIGIANQQAVMDAQTTAGNNEKVDEYNQALVERGIAQQREQSANLANAGDKMTLIRNEKEKGRVELEKANVLKGIYEKSGVGKRYGFLLKEAGIKNPSRANGEWLPEDIEEPKKEAYGGLMQGIPKKTLYARGGTMDPGPKDPLATEKAFFSSYIQSPKYKERLTRQGYTNVPQVIKDRNARLQGTTLFTDTNNVFASSFYSAPDNTVVMAPTADKKLGYSAGTVRPHEMSHAAGSIIKIPKGLPAYLGLNAQEQLLLSDRDRLRQRGPHELKADMDTLRYFMKRDGIYDTGTQDFTDEYLKKARAKYSNDPAVKRLFSTVTDKDLIYLMNNIAVAKTASQTNIA